MLNKFKHDTAPFLLVSTPTPRQRRRRGAGLAFAGRLAPGLNFYLGFKVDTKAS